MISGTQASASQEARTRKRKSLQIWGRVRHLLCHQHLPCVKTRNTMQGFELALFSHTLGAMTLVSEPSVPSSKKETVLRSGKD
ncbi:hypothetical protein PoB_004860300 [Plakobranchus ocellatus]|uniref:Uncharacterized protein n=1 Tax=Plakobranchus ocellatus TaxID=259542 RepID=A0AAV4BSE7_9GAST|nr:hypothetical protein PoB_004860300 [Plakobranchus ocellatus]